MAVERSAPHPTPQTDTWKQGAECRETRAMPRERLNRIQFVWTQEEEEGESAEQSDRRLRLEDQG